MDLSEMLTQPTQIVDSDLLVLMPPDRTSVALDAINRADRDLGEALEASKTASRSNPRAWATTYQQEASS